MAEKIRYTKGTAPLCNVCGLTTWIEPPNLRPGDMSCAGACGLIDAHPSGGFESTPGNGWGALDDMTVYHFSICEFCLDWLFSSCKIPPKVFVVFGDGEKIEEPFRCADERVSNGECRTMKEEYFAESRRRAEARDVRG